MSSSRLGEEELEDPPPKRDQIEGFEEEEEAGFEDSGRREL